MPSYLVTGGAGFIGSHLVEALHGRGQRVRIVDNFVTGTRENLKHLTSVEVIEGDLSDPDVAGRAVEGMEYVLHQAAIPSVPRSVADPVASHRANASATLALLVAARDAGVRRVVYAGSSSVYGDSPELPKREDMTGRTLSPYALQKWIGEEYARLFTALYGLETVTIRYFNVFGPRQDPSSPYSGVISLFITSLLSGSRPVIYGDGEQTRDFTFVRNVVDGVLRACEADVSGRVINVATGGRVSINRLFRTLADILGVDVEPIYEPARAGDVRHSQADIGLARRLLRYEPSTGFEEGLRRTVDWYRQVKSR
jgi:nucleoside-diphosphate-sugar epimerase